MACTGSTPTIDATSIVSSNCGNFLTITFSQPCGNTGYAVNLYRGAVPGADPDVVLGTEIFVEAMNPGPESGAVFTYNDVAPPCGRGSYKYKFTISCGTGTAALAESSVLVATAQGGAADITFSDVSANSECVVTTRAQISKPCGECAGTIKCFRKAGSPVTFDGSEVIYTSAVPAGPLIGDTYQTTDTPGDGQFYYAWRVYDINGVVDDEYNPGYIVNACNIYNPFTTELPPDQIEKQVVLVRVTKVGGYYIYTDDRMLGLKEQRIDWWYHKNGGCGAFRFLTHETFDDLRQDLDVSWEVHVRIKMPGETIHTTWYRGIIRSISTEEQGAEQFSEIRGYGYVELLDNVMVQHKYPAGMTVKQIVDDIIDSYIKPNTRVRRPSEVDLTNGDSGVDNSPYVTGSEVHFECSALKALKFLAELQGNREFGVDAHGAIYFRTNVTTISKNFYLANDIVKRVAGGKTFIQSNDIKIGGKSFGSTNYLLNRQDVTDITNNGLYESALEVPWLTGDKDASTWADNVIAKNKDAQLWQVFTWKHVTENIFAEHPVGKIKVYGADISNDVTTLDIAKINFIEGGWTTRQEVREMGSPTVQPELDQQLLKATIYAGYYPRDIVEELEVRMREQLEFLKGKHKQYRYPNDVTNLPYLGRIPGELIHLSKDVTNSDITNNPLELQDLTNPRGLLAAWLDKQWTKISTRRTVHSLPARGKFIGEIVSLITDPTFSSYGVVYVWSGTAWSVVGSGSGTNLIEGARMQKSTDTTISPGGTTISFDTQLANDNGVWSITNPTRLTARTTGYFNIAANALWSKGINGTYREIRIVKRSGAVTTTIAKDRKDDYVHNVQRTNSIETTILLLRDDYIELIADTDAVDAGNTLVSSSEVSPILAMALVSGGGTAGSVIGTPSGPAGGDLSGAYPSPTVVGLQGNTLPTKIADGFLKRNSGNTAWEDVTYGNLRARFVRTGPDAIKIDEWADARTDVNYCDVTLPARHGLAPKPTGWRYDSLKGDTSYAPASEDDVTVKLVSEIFDFAGTKRVSSSYYTPSGSGTGVGFISIYGKSYYDYAGVFNAPGQNFPSSVTIYPLDTIIDYTVDYRTGPNSGDLTNVRLWIVLEDHNAETYQQDNPTVAKSLGFRFSNSTSYGQAGTDTHWMAYVSNGSSSTVVDTGITPTLDTPYEFYIDRTDSNRILFYINKVLVATITTNTPHGGGCSHRSTIVGNSGDPAKHFRQGKFIVRFR